MAGDDFERRLREQREAAGRRWAHENVSFICKACNRVVPGDGDGEHEMIITFEYGKATPRVSMGLCYVKANAAEAQHRRELGGW